MIILKLIILILQLHIIDTVNKQDIPKLRKKIQEAIEGKDEFVCTYRLIKKDMEYTWVSLKATIIERTNNSYIFYGSYFDVNNLKIKSERDLLTGLYNKQAFKEIVSQDLTRRPKLEDGYKSMILIDIDNFKGINDNYGHSYGDKVLKKISEEIMSIFRTGDIISRLGGDEFGVYIPQNIPKEIVFKRVDQLRKQLQMKFFENGINVETTASIGIAFTEGKNVTYQKLINSADEVQYKSKKSGKNRQTTCFV